MKTVSFMNKKGALVAVVGVVAVAVIGMTFALSKDRAILGNDFALANYQTVTTDEFVSPSNWQPCQTIPKTITVTNTSDMPVAVRIKLEEDWIAADGVTHLPPESEASGILMAEIEFTDDEKWEFDGKYDRYVGDLAPNETTSPLFTGVTLNCDANLDTSESAAPDSDGAYAGAEYHLKVIIQTAQADKADEIWDDSLVAEIKKQVNRPYTINFADRAIVSNDLATANGNGVNKFTENGVDIYYYRGEIYNNNVIWANKCWKILRTTYTGGTKMIYNGEPTTVDGKSQCLATGDDTLASVVINRVRTNKIPFSDSQTSPADVGYMYGDRINRRSYDVRNNRSQVFVFSNDIIRDGDTYTLDTSEGQSIAGTWVNKRWDAALRYHYFCTNGSDVCSGAEIGYICNFDRTPDFIRYLPVGGYDDIEAMKTAMFANDYDSSAKIAVETWFEQERLDWYEDELEDAVFCSDREYEGNSALKSKDTDARPKGYDMYGYNYHAPAIRASGDSGEFDEIIYTPSLECQNRRDAFTVSSSLGNGKLIHKVGLITADEAVLAGWGEAISNVVDGWAEWYAANYLFTGQNIWTMSPFGFEFDAGVATFGAYSLTEYPANNGDYPLGFRPVVSLKARTQVVDGTGLKTDPYIIW